LHLLAYTGFFIEVKTGYINGQKKEKPHCKANEESSLSLQTKNAVKLLSHTVKIKEESCRKSLQHIKRI